MNCPVCNKYQGGVLVKGRCNKCSYEDFKTIVREQVDTLGQPKRQEILDLLRKSGLSVGEICKRLGLETMIVSTVIVDNIKDVHYLSEVAR